MHNLTYLIGRIVKEPEVKESESGKKYSNITLAVQRSYKNADGEYETDYIDCALFDNMAVNTAEYCRQGDLVGIKGRIQTNTYETEDGEKRKSTQVVTEKISFLASKREKEDDIDKSDAEIEM